MVPEDEAVIAPFPFVDVTGQFVDEVEVPSLTVDNDNARLPEVNQFDD